MAIIRWSPWSISNFLEDDWEIPTFPGLNRLGQGLNLYETGNTVVAEAALPGIPEESIEVTVDNRIVRITGQMTEKKEEKRRNFMSTMSSSYNYSFRLPEEVQVDKDPKVELDNGILTLSFPKVTKEPPKKLKVIKKLKERK